MTNQIQLQAIGHVESPRKVIEDDNWGEVVSSIVLDENVLSVDAALGLDLFSHIEVIFYMDRVLPEKVQRGARHPRNNKEIPLMGILAQRAKSRVNLLGLTRCKVQEVRENVIVVKGLDAIDGTAVLDIKPWFEEFGPQEPSSQPDWTRSLMSNYW